jgi:hypothetical protein
MVRWPGFVTVLALAMVLRAPASAQELHTVLPAVAVVCLKTDDPIELDGRLNETAWQRAPTVSGFTISGSEELAGNQTSMAVARDEDALYVGVRCQEERMDGLKADVRGPDARVWHDDCVEVFVDANHDHRSFMQFAVNSIPARFDGKSGADTWDSEWEAAADTDEDGWTVELRIPFASMEAEPPAEGAVWGLNVCRERLATGTRELHNWANVQGNFHRPWLFGHLYFAGHELELTPEIAAGLYAATEFPTRVYLHGGYALIGPRGVQERREYRELLAEAVVGAGELVELREELLRTYARGADVPYAKEFESLDRSFRRLLAAARSQEPVPALLWAEQTVRIDGLRKEMHDLSWKVKLALLLRDA